MVSTTADLCDKFPSEVTPLDPILRSFGRTPICAGRVETVSVTTDNSAIDECLRAPGEKRILVVSVKSPEPCAVFGDRLATMAVANGWGGLVIHGYVRDVDALHQTPIAIWALGTYPRRGAKGEKGVRGGTLRFAGVEIGSGDFLSADHDGIVVSKRTLPQ